MDEELIDLIKRHEGVRVFPYIDTMGKMTIGVGHNLTDNGVSNLIINTMLAEDINIAKSELDKTYPRWRELSDNRKMVVVSMMFNMGLPKYMTFKRFWKALTAGQYDLAADEMIDSKWARQVKGRATDLSNMMRTG